jgi:hypothetical protein
MLIARYACWWWLSQQERRPRPATVTPVLSQSPCARASTGTRHCRHACVASQCSRRVQREEDVRCCIGRSSSRDCAVRICQSRRFLSTQVRWRCLRQLPPPCCQRRYAQARHLRIYSCREACLVALPPRASVRIVVRSHLVCASVRVCCCIAQPAGPCRLLRNAVNLGSSQCNAAGAAT